MPKTKSRTKLSLGTKEARLEAAQSFTPGDRVRHQVTGSIGKFDSINLGFALPEVWVQFETDTEFRVPISCNPIELELVERSLESPLSSVASVESRACATEAFPQPTLESGEGSDTLLNCWKPGMRVWSERTVSTKGKPDQVKRMTGVVMGTTSRQIVPDQTSVDPIDTPLVKVQWDGAKFTVLLSPGELHMESSDDQFTTATPALASQDAVIPEVIEELTEEEASERHRLELKVERAFYEAGVALRGLRDKRLYRSTHKTFEEYCRDRFGMTPRPAYYLIAAAGVVDNLEMRTNGSQILPTSERQVRPLTTLEPEEQREVWQQAVEQAGGKVPSGRIVKGIVERLKEKPLYKATDFCQPHQVFTLIGLSGQERKYNGCPGVAIAVNDFTVEVDVHDAVLTVKPDNLNPIDSPGVRRQLPSILKRIKRLRQCDLDRGAYHVLEGLGQQTYLTEFEEGLLSWLENYYGVG